MDILSIVFIAFALSMDAFAVSIASGVIIRRQQLRKAVTFGLMFGGFQMLMPVLGYGAGRTFRSHIMSRLFSIVLSLVFAAVAAAADVSVDPVTRHFSISYPVPTG